MITSFALMLQAQPTWLIRWMLRHAHAAKTLGYAAVRRREAGKRSGFHFEWVAVADC
jgi:hypothetical protein